MLVSEISNKTAQPHQMFKMPLHQMVTGSD